MKRFTQKDWRIIRAAMAQMLAGEWDQTVGDKDVDDDDVHRAMSKVEERMKEAAR